MADADLALLRTHLPQFTYLHYPGNHGKGYALRTGVKKVQESLCLFTDIDFPYEETSVAAVYEALRAGRGDVVVGMRDESYYAHVPLSRMMISKVLRRSTQLLLGLAVSDTQCGLKGFNRRGQAVFLHGQTDRYLFDLEFVFLASRPAAGLQVIPVPVRLKPGIVFSRMSPKFCSRRAAATSKFFWPGWREDPQLPPDHRPAHARRGIAGHRAAHGRAIRPGVLASRVVFI